MQIERKQSGYPSIDKPWLKYYKKEAINASIPQKNMFELICESNAGRLNYNAMIYYGNRITYSTFFEQVETVKNALIGYGVKTGDVVSILSLNIPEASYLIYALNSIGAVANLLVANTSNAEIAVNLKSTKSKLFFVLDLLLGKMGQFDCPVPVVILSAADSAKGCAKLLFKAAAPRKLRGLPYCRFIQKHGEAADTHTDTNSPAIIVYTSGTTGSPKGVVLSSNNLNSCAIQCFYSGQNHQPGESFLNILPPFYSFGIGMKHLCFLEGMTEIPAIVPKVPTIMKMMKKHRPERFIIGPAISDVIEKYPWKDLSFLLELTGGGGSISAEKENMLNAILASKGAKSKYLSGYGMTELSAAVSMNHNEHYHMQSIGYPFALTNVKVCSTQTGEELPYGEEGELLVCSPSLMLGYFNNQKETDSVIETAPDGSRWMHTGDIARIGEDGFIFITGRLKRIFIVTDDNNIAYKVFPQRMEELIQQMPGVEKCGVAMKKNENSGYVPIVFITVDTDRTAQNIQKEVMKKISENLPDYYLPEAIILLDAMPVTANQKIDYRRLEQMAAQ